MRAILTAVFIMTMAYSAFCEPDSSWLPKSGVKLAPRIDISGAWSMAQPPKAKLVDVSQGEVIMYQWLRDDFYSISIEIDRVEKWPFRGKTREVELMASENDLNAKANKVSNWPATKYFSQREYGKVSGCDAVRMLGVYPSGEYFCGEMRVWGKQTRVRAVWVVKGRQAEDECEAAFASLMLKAK